MKYLTTLIILMVLIVGEASALPINETVKNFRISFDAVNDPNTVIKFWDNNAIDKLLEQMSSEISKLAEVPENKSIQMENEAAIRSIFKNKITDVALVAALNINETTMDEDEKDEVNEEDVNEDEEDPQILGCAIFVLKNPEDTNNTEFVSTEILAEATSTKYLRVSDRTVDGHKALLLKTGDRPSDPSMDYIAQYCLDEVNGKATKFVFVFSTWPGTATERLLNTIHIEEISRPN